MAEQSSTVAAFRALVMLACLILIPVAAFCGSSFPAVVKAIESGRWPTLADFRGPAGPPPSQLAEAPRYSRPPQPTVGPQLSDPKTSGYAGTAAGLGTARQFDPAPSGVVQATYNAPIGSPANISPVNGSNPPTSFPQNRDRLAGQDRGLSSVGNDGGLFPPQDLATAGQTGDAAHSAGAGSSRDSQLNSVVKRLQELGVTYFVLEPCGDQRDMFRFYCKMAVGGNPQVTKPFWSFDSDPLKAVTRVLKQVEESQTGGG